MRALAACLLMLAACGRADQERPARPTPPGLIIADDICAQIIGAAPAEAREEGWSIVTRDDLAAPDREIWSTYHRVECPGLAEDIAWIGYSQPVYAVTSVQRNGDTLMQKVVLLRPGANGYTAQTVWGPSEVPTPHVVYISSVPNERETPPLQYPAFVFERLETSVIAFYEEEGQLRSRSWEH